MLLLLLLPLLLLPLPLMMMFIPSSPPPMLLTFAPPSALGMETLCRRSSLSILFQCSRQMMVFSTEIR
jgi:hypothetical protein